MLKLDIQMFSGRTYEFEIEKDTEIIPGSVQVTLTPNIVGDDYFISDTIDDNCTIEEELTGWEKCGDGAGSIRKVYTENTTEQVGATYVCDNGNTYYFETIVEVTEIGAEPEEPVTPTTNKYTPIGWKDDEEGNTPINADNLNHMDKAILDLYNGGATTTEIVISETEPKNEDWKIWIDTNELNNLGSEVVNTLEGNETNKAPSVNAVNRLNTYVPEETQIGWYKFNGIDFPLYRKEIAGSLGETGSDDIGELPCEIIIDIKGRMVSPSGYKIPIQFYSSPTSFISCALTTANHVMLYYSDNFKKGTYRLILEYVKSTTTASIDEEV